MDTRVGTAQVGELAIAFREAGQGAPLVLLHGFVSDARIWRRQLDGRSLVLADSYAGWKGSLPESERTERLESCLRASRGAPEAVVAKLLPGMFTGQVSGDVRAELAAIMAAFHPVGFRVMSRSSAEMDTRDLLPAIGA